MTREEFIQACCLRMVGTIPANTVKSDMILATAKQIADGIYGITEDEKKASLEEENKKKKRKEELKSMPKNYVLSFQKYTVSNWDHYDNEAKIYSSSVMCQKDIAKQIAHDAFYDRPMIIYPVAEYCFITEDQAKELLNMKRRPNEISKNLEYITSAEDWYELCKTYSLQRMSLRVLYDEKYTIK